MAGSAAERKRKQIEKLKESGKYEEFKRKQTEKQRQRRQNIKTSMTFDKKELLKRKRREEQRKHRMKYKTKTNTEVTSAEKISPTKIYKTRCSFGKAIAKAKRGLPQSPRKCSAVVKTLAMHFSPNILKEPKLQHLHGDRCISNEVKQSVLDFFNNDTISYQAPGRKDFVIIRSNGKQKIQKRYLFFTLGETHELFKKEHPNKEIGLSKFSELRPKHICLRSETPGNLCLCIYHENIRLLLLAAKDLPKRTSDFIIKIVCSSEKKDCMLSKCENCRRNIELILDENAEQEEIGDDEVQYQQWLKDEQGKITRQKLSGTMSEIFNKLKEKVPQFLQHEYIRKSQADSFENLKNHLSSDAIILHIDFSENYNFQYQDEIQSAHWNSESCTLYTAILYYKNNNMDLCFESYVVVSNYLTHDKYAVVSFNNVILENFKKNHPEHKISSIHYQSDGTGQHFKQKYSLSYITLQNMQIIWHFSATAHGKGPIDGLGGTVKRRLRESTNSRQIDPRNAKEFADCAKIICPNINIIYVDEKDIDCEKLNMDRLWCPNGREVHNIPDTRTYHCFRSSNNYEIECSHISSEQPIIRFNFLTGKTSKSDTESKLDKDVFNAVDKDMIKAGDWVLVPFAGRKCVKYFVGQVLIIEGEEAKVKFLHFNVENLKFYWPEIDDECYIHVKEINRKLPEPTFDRSMKCKFNFNFSGINLA